MELSLTRLPWYGQLGAFVLLALGGVGAFVYYYEMPVRADFASREAQLESLKKEGEAGEPELEGGVGDLVDLPGDCDRLGLRTDDDHQARGLVQTEVAGTEGIARTGGLSTVGVCHFVMVAYFAAAVIEWLHARPSDWRLK